ncbi:MAG: hypothetical protein M3P04_06680 [Actinomycetota bacterium]|nr:hypothetical protein [Actinomycetota bacterium]
MVAVLCGVAVGFPYAVPVALLVGTVVLVPSLRRLLAADIEQARTLSAAPLTESRGIERFEGFVRGVPAAPRWTQAILRGHEAHLDWTPYWSRRRDWHCLTVKGTEAVELRQPGPTDAGIKSFGMSVFSLRGNPTGLEVAVASQKEVALAQLLERLCG